MVSTLILKVGDILTEQKIMREKQESMEEFSSFKGEFNSLKGEFSSFKEEAKTRHQEVMEKLTSTQADQDHIWGKTVKNERDLGILKTYLNYKLSQKSAIK